MIMNVGDQPFWLPKKSFPLSMVEVWLIEFEYFWILYYLFFFFFFEMYVYHAPSPLPGVTLVWLPSPCFPRYMQVQPGAWSEPMNKETDHSRGIKKFLMPCHIIM